jgi:hypothetical protein
LQTVGAARDLGGLDRALVLRSRRPGRDAEAFT